MKLHEMDQRLSTLAELVTANVVGTSPIMPSPMLMLRRSEPEDLIKRPKPPYSTEYFAAPVGMIRALEGKTKPSGALGPGDLAGPCFPGALPKTGATSPTSPTSASKRPATARSKPKSRG